ncbi:MAG: hypothetical protein CTY33_00175 [Methylotenera sp.]|nr:MAG: hypothetical protein CTY33_00175 [Methylotenera sp.]
MRILLSIAGVIVNTILLAMMDLSGWQMVGVFMVCLIVILQTLFTSSPKTDDGKYCEYEG